MKDEDKTQAQPKSESLRLRQNSAVFERERVQFNRFVEADPYFNSSDMLASTDGDTEKIRHCNEALCKKLGYVETEIVGHPISKIYHPDCLEDAKSMYTSLVSKGEIHDLELVLRKKDGNSIEVNSSASTIRDTIGDLLYCRFIWRDISQYREIERELRASEALFHQLANSIREVFWLMSLEGDEFFYLSPGYDEIWGRSRMDLMADPMSWVDSIYPDDIEQVIAHFERQKLGEFVEYDFRMVRPDGEIRWIHARAFPVEDENGVPHRVAGFALDITERKRAEEQLIQASNMALLGQLTAGVAHEISNPTNFVLLNGESLQKSWSSVIPFLDEYCGEHGDFMCAGMPYSKLRGRISKLATGIIDGANRIKKIVDALGDFSQSGSEDLSQPVNCNAVIDSAAEIMQNLIKTSTNHFSTQFEDNLPDVLGNSQHLEQVFINLITNACHALPDPGKKIVVSTRTSSKGVLIEVCDEGEGIPPENLGRIMDAFFTTKQGASGVGLGLSISYNIVKNHGGELTFSSELGKGTTASVKLPAAP